MYTICNHCFNNVSMVQDIVIWCVIMDFLFLYKVACHAERTQICDEELLALLSIFSKYVLCANITLSQVFKEHGVGRIHVSLCLAL